MRRDDFWLASRYTRPAPQEEAGSATFPTGSKPQLPSGSPITTISRFIRNLRSRGAKITCFKVLFVLRGLAFDLIRGTRTTATSTIDQHGLPAGSGTGNFPSHPAMLRRALRALSVAPEDVLLDIGCGRGRVLLIAAEFPFKRIIGLDIVPENVEYARRNLAAARVPNAEVLLVDARDDLPLATVWCFFRLFEPERLAELVGRSSAPPRAIILGNARIDIPNFRSVRLEQHRIYPNFRYEVLVREDAR